MPLPTSETVALLAESLRDSSAANTFSDIGVSRKGGSSIVARTLKRIVLTRLSNRPLINGLLQVGKQDIYALATRENTTSFSFRVTAAKRNAAWFNVGLQELERFVHDRVPTVDRYVRYRTIIGQALADAAEGYVPLGNELREKQFAWYKLFVSDHRPHLKVHDRRGSDQAYDIQLDLPMKGFGYIKHRLLEGKVVIELLGCTRPQEDAHG